MRILAVSDLHGSISGTLKTSVKAGLIDAQIVIVCGDITHFGDLTKVERLLSILTGSGVPTLFVPGNCDPKELINMSSVADAHNVHSRKLTFDGIDFIGVGGGLLSPFSTPFEVEEEEMAHFVDQIRRERGENRSILISHTPPYDTTLDLTKSGVHVGSVAIRDFIEETRPLTALCGHIHEAGGIDQVKGVPVVNTGSAKWGMCAVIDVKDGVEVRLDRL